MINNIKLHFYAKWAVVFLVILPIEINFENISTLHARLGYAVVTGVVTGICVLVIDEIFYYFLYRYRK